MVAKTSQELGQVEALGLPTMIANDRLRARRVAFIAKRLFGPSNGGPLHEQGLAPGCVSPTSFPGDNSFGSAIGLPPTQILS
jgi:hypothetical protein